MADRTKPCDAPGCKGTARMDSHCGAYVCDTCGEHVGLVRCYCGWSAAGGDGRAELLEAGEVLEEDY